MKRIRLGVLVAVAALVVGVTAAWAGFPHFKSTTSTFDAGTTTSGATTTSATTSAVTLAASTEPSFTVTYSGTAFHDGDVVHASVDGVSNWACINNGSNVPSDTNGAKAPTPFDLSGTSFVGVVRNGKAAGEVVIVLTAPTTGLTCQGTQHVGLYSLALRGGIEIWSETGGAESPHEAVAPPSNLPYCLEPGNAACLT